MILVIDNYDSFTFNLVHMLRAFGAEVRVARNDALDIAGVRALSPSHIVLSPGPGHPRESGVCLDILRDLSATTPTLGVCLGHQALGLVFGGRVGRAPELKHGEATKVYHDDVPLFRGLRNPFDAGRYHSLIVEEEGLPKELSVTAYTSDGTIMALAHSARPLFGVQFHPESILTPDGPAIVRNFLETPILF